MSEREAFVSIHTYFQCVGVRRWEKSNPVVHMYTNSCTQTLLLISETTGVHCHPTMFICINV